MSDVLWPEKFKASSEREPKVLLEEQAKQLPKLTNELVIARVDEEETFDYSANPWNSYSFKYGFYITGSRLANYEFRAFVIAYGIPYYTLSIFLDSEIQEELGVLKWDKAGIDIESEEQLKSLLKAVFNSKKIYNIVSAIMGMSK